MGGRDRINPGVLLYLLRSHSAGQKPRTQVAPPKGYIIPDAAFRHVAPDGEARLFALEMYNGRETHRVERQLVRYLVALEHEAIEAYSRPKSPSGISGFVDTYVVPLREQV